MLEINRNPSSKELRWFGLALLVFFGVIGGIVFLRTQSLSVPKILWSLGGGLTVLYSVFSPARRPIFVGFGYVTLPLRWVITYAVLALTFYGVLTPLALLMRALGHDPLRRRFEVDRQSYWQARKRTRPASSYFRQF